MRSIILKIAALMLSALLFALFLIAIIPCFIITYIRDAYREDRAVARLHKEIECFLSNERDENEYWQIKAW